jgi:RHS repeat-associated protein
LNDASNADVGYDGLRRRVQLRHLRADNSQIIGFGHTYDRMNNKLSEEKRHAATDSELYHFDSAYRLLQFDRGRLNGSNDAIVAPSGNAPLHRQWTLDGVGNWERVDNETRQHSSFNEITARNSVGTTTMSHDDNGNVTDDGAFTLAWDYANRLRTVTRKSDGARIAAYAYDALYRRIRKVVTNSGALNGTTDFYLDGWQVIEERNGADGVTQQYVYGVGIDEPLVMDQNQNGDGTATGTGDRRFFYHQNTLDSVFALTDEAGQIVEGYQSDAYGRQTVFGPGPNGVVNFGGDDVVRPGGVSAVSNPYMYTGRRLDGETGLYYYRRRYHDPVTGRFLSRDPINFIGPRRINRYQYVMSNPLRFVDPMGLDTIEGMESGIYFSYLLGALDDRDIPISFRARYEKNDVVYEDTLYEWDLTESEKEAARRFIEKYRASRVWGGVVRVAQRVTGVRLTPLGVVQLTAPWAPVGTSAWSDYAGWPLAWGAIPPKEDQPPEGPIPGLEPNPPAAIPPSNPNCDINPSPPPNPFPKHNTSPVPLAYQSLEALPFDRSRGNNSLNLQSRAMGERR